MAKDVTANEGAGEASVAPHGAAEVGRAPFAAATANDGASGEHAALPIEVSAADLSSLPAVAVMDGRVGMHEDPIEVATAVPPSPANSTNDGDSGHLTAPFEVASEDSTPLLADADGDRIIALLAELGGPADAAGTTLVADVAFGLALADVLVADGGGGAGSEFMGLDDGAGAASSGGSVEGVHLAEIPTGTLDGAMPIEVPAIKIIFDDDGSTSGSLI